MYLIERGVDRDDAFVLLRLARCVVFGKENGNRNTDRICKHIYSNITLIVSQKSLDLYYSSLSSDLLIISVIIVDNPLWNGSNLKSDAVFLLTKSI